MKGRNPLRRGLPAFLLVCGLLPASAQAQFTQQGPKLVGTGAVGTPEQAILSRSPLTGIPPSLVDIRTTTMSVPHGSSRARVRYGASKQSSSAQAL